MRKTVGVIIALVLSTAAMIAQTTWKSDKAHSRVNFSVTHMLVAEVTGRFTDFDATVVASKDDFSDAQIEATIKTASLNTDNDRRDAHVKSDDFLNVEKFPEIKFKSSKVEKGDNGYLKITGTLTIRDSTKSVLLDAKYNGQVKMANGVKAGLKATVTINRFEFGVNWNRALETGGLIASKEVSITLLLELNQQMAETKGN